MKTFENVAGLALANLTAGQEVSTKGYYTAGDGGQATYLIVAPTTADEFGDHTLANTNVAKISISGRVNVKQFGATGDGVTDDAPSIQAAIDFAVSGDAGSVFLSDGTTDNTFGGAIYAPKGTYKVNVRLIINAIAEETVGSGALYSGVRFYGDSSTSTVFDGSSVSPAGPTIAVDAAWVQLDNFQVLNSNDHGIRIATSGWGSSFRNLYINNPLADGIFFDRSFVCTLEDCVVFGAGGWGFSWNSYHTSWTIQGNYALQCASGGYFVGDRVTPNNSLGMVYSTFLNNACDGGQIAYTLYGCRAVTLTGCGCEVISGDAVLISGTDTNVSVNNFFAVSVGGAGVSVSGNRAKVEVNGFVDITPTAPNMNLFLSQSDGGQLSLKNITDTRTGALYDTSVFTGLVDRSDNQFITTVTVPSATSTAPVCNITHANRVGINITGMVTVTAISGLDRSDTLPKQQGVYILAVSISASGAAVSLAAEAGGVAAGTDVWPAFDWSIDGSNNLVATHKNAPIAVDRSFTFVFEPSNNMSCVTAI